MVTGMIESGIMRWTAPDSYRLLRSKPLRSYSSRFSIEISRGKYTLRTVSSHRELTEVLKLRYEVFHREFIGKKLPFGLDIDDLDAHCDHLAIFDNQTRRIIGTYRLLPSTALSGFYSEREFQIRDFLKEPFIKVELGRACIQKDHRNGFVISLLWRGIAEYGRLVHARYLFGCASVQVTTPDHAAEVLRVLEAKNALGNEWAVSPIESYRMQGFESAWQKAKEFHPPESDSPNMIPGLVHSYLSAGAKIYGEPAFDEDFRCIDLFTVMDLNQLQARYSRRYA